MPTICILAGALGSAVRAIRSAIERTAKGWEFADGTPWPEQEPEGKFNARMVPGFFIRPLIGAATGLVLYLGTVGGALLLMSSGDRSGADPLSLGFFAFVVGLFAKTFLDKLFPFLPTAKERPDKGKS